MVRTVDLNPRTSTCSPMIANEPFRAANLRLYLQSAKIVGDVMVQAPRVGFDRTAKASSQESNPTQLRKPRVLILPANRRGPLPEGIGVQFERGGQAIIEELEQLGFVVEFTDVNPWPLNPLGNKPSMLKAIDPLRALRILLCRPRPDIVMSYFESGALLLVLFRRFFLFRAPIVIVDVGVGGGSRLRSLFLRIIIPRVSAIFVYSSNQIAYIRAHYRTKANLAFIRARVDTQFYRPQSTRQDYILAVGDDFSRDYATLLEAAIGLDIDVVLKTSKIVENRNLHPNVSVISSRLSGRELRDLYDKAKLVVMPLHPTLTAGGVTAFLEAMAMGKAQVVSQSPGLQDYILAGKNSVVVPCHDAKALRAAIVELLGDDELRKKIGESARACAKTEFSSARFARQLADQFRLLLEQ